MPDPPPDYDAMSYEQLVEALENVTNRLASDDLGIEDAADLYEEAGRLHAGATARLAKVRERIERLQKTADQKAADEGITSEGPAAP
jgi:exodeoxyribonuclease VII small subunit